MVPAVVITFSKVALTGQLSDRESQTILLKMFSLSIPTVHGSLFEIKNVTSFSFKTILSTQLSKIVVSAEAITSGPLGSQRF